MRSRTASTIAFKQGGPAVEFGAEDENATLDSMARDALEHGVSFGRAVL